jgi:Protein kinase domain
MMSGQQQGMCTLVSSTCTTVEDNNNNNNNNNNNSNNNNSNNNNNDDTSTWKQCRENCTCSGYGRVCSYSAMLAGETAVRAVALLREDSQLFPPNTKVCDSLHKVKLSDVVMGESLGEGGFCVVKACWINGKELAIKYLRRPVMVSRKQFLYGAADLAQEAYFLHALHHDHIIRLHSVTDASLRDSFASGKDCGFFITVDRLYDTLEQRLEQWRQQEEKDKHHHHHLYHPGGLFFSTLASFRSSSTSSSSSSSEAKDHKRELFRQKLQIALDIASALQYLHQNNVIFRDLKVSLS